MTPPKRLSQTIHGGRYLNYPQQENDPLRRHKIGPFLQRKPHNSNISNLLKRNNELEISLTAKHPIPTTKQASPTIKQTLTSKHGSINQLRRTKTRSGVQATTIPAPWKQTTKCPKQPPTINNTLNLQNQHHSPQLPRTNNTTPPMVRLERNPNDTRALVCSRTEAYNMAAAGSTVMAIHDKLDVGRRPL